MSLVRDAINELMNSDCCSGVLWVNPKTFMDMINEEEEKRYGLGLTEKELVIVSPKGLKKIIFNISPDVNEANFALIPSQVEPEDYLKFKGI